MALEVLWLESPTFSASWHSWPFPLVAWWSSSPSPRFLSLIIGSVGWRWTELLLQIVLLRPAVSETEGRESGTWCGSLFAVTHVVVAMLGGLG